MQNQPPNWGPPPPYPGPPPPPYPGPSPSYGRGASDDLLWALLGYVLAIFASIIAPLVIYLVKMNESAYVRFHAAQALNMGLTALIYWFGLFIVFIPVGFATKGAGFLLIPPLFFVIMIVHLVFLILAAVRAHQGQLYRAPAVICFPMVR